MLNRNVHGFRDRNVWSAARAAGLPDDWLPRGLPHLVQSARLWGWEAVEEVLTKLNPQGNFDAERAWCEVGYVDEF